MKNLLGEVSACPVCKTKVKLTNDGKKFECLKCGRFFHIDDGVPIMMSSEVQAEMIALINNETIGTTDTDWHKLKTNHPLLYKVVRGIKPPFRVGSLHKYVYSQLIKLLDEFKTPRILIVGSGVEEGSGAEILGHRFKDNMLNMDIAKFKSVDIVGDTRYLPFLNESFHGVILQGVLEHVPDSQKVVDEITRVCLNSGYIYIAIPWMQCFHPDPGDYQRYSIQGLRQLFNQFEIVYEGALAGPASAAHIVLSEFLASFSDHKQIRRAIRFFARWILSPILIFDFYLLRKKYAYVNASSVFIIGRKKIYR